MEYNMKIIKLGRLTQSQCFNITNLQFGSIVIYLVYHICASI